MKHLMIIALLTSFFSLSALASDTNMPVISEPAVLGNVDTECEMMKGGNRSSINPKAHLIDANQTTRVEPKKSNGVNQ